MHRAILKSESGRGSIGNESTCRLAYVADRLGIIAFRQT